MNNNGSILQKKIICTCALSSTHRCQNTIQNAWKIYCNVQDLYLNIVLSSRLFILKCPYPPYKRHSSMLCFVVFKFSRICVFVCLEFIVPLENFSLTLRRHKYLWCHEAGKAVHKCMEDYITQQDYVYQCITNRMFLCWVSRLFVRICLLVFQL